LLELNFYPQFDVYHAAFRALSILRFTSNLEIEAYRIFDYFILNPFDLGTIRARGSRGKRIAEQFEEQRPYRWIVEPASLFLRMTEFQTLCISALRQNGTLDGTEFAARRLQLSESYVVSADTISLSDAFIAERRVVLSYLDDMLKEYGLDGQNGLKSRTSLMDHRYDVRQHGILD
jgi:hypothetical protein